MAKASEFIYPTSPIPDGYKFILEEHERPSDRDQLVEIIRQQIHVGGVVKLNIQAGHPLKVVRLVSEESAPGLPAHIVDTDVYTAVRNAEMEEFLLPEAMKPLDYLFKAFHRLSEKASPKAILVSRLQFLSEWLGVDASWWNKSRELFGVRIIENGEVPDDVLVLVGHEKTDPEAVAFSLRLVMEGGK